MFASRGSAHNKPGPVEADPLVGAELGGDFLVRRVLARGGESVAYLAAQKSVADREVVVKVPDMAFWVLASREKHREANPYLKELRVASIASHAAFAHIYASGQVKDGRPFIAMEYLRGPTLSEVLQKRGPLAPPLVAELVLQLSSALGALHRNAIVYRDLKPSHIVLQPDQGLGPQMRLLDLGAAQTTYQRDSAARFAEGQAVGSPGYLSPELAQGKPGDERSDVFSMAAVVYEMLAGIPAIHIEQPGPERLLKYVLTESTPLPTLPLAQVRPDLPAPLDGVLARGMARRARQRHATVVALRDELLAALEGAPLPTTGGGVLSRLKGLLDRPLW